MKTSTAAVYENGALRPTEPLPLAEGETVQITVMRAAPTEQLDEDEIIQMIRSAKTPEEVFAILETHSDDSDYDLAAALNENRRLAGDLRLFTLSEPGEKRS